MTRLSIEITAAAPDDFMSQATILLGCKTELEALTAKLRELGVEPKSDAGFIRETVRKPKAIPANPAAPPADTVVATDAALADDPDQLPPNTIAAPAALPEHRGRRHAAE